MNATGRKRLGVRSIGACVLAASVAVMQAADGDLDGSFGNGGWLTTDFAGTRDVAHGITTDANGRIVVVGSTRKADGDDFAIVRYNTDGTVDPTFGADGRVSTDFGQLWDDARDVLVDANGRLLVVGGAEVYRYTDEGRYISDDFGLARYNADGTLDTTFGANGQVVTDIGHIDGATAAAFAGGGKVVVAGTSYPSFALARYNEDGSLDPTFGAGGTIKVLVGKQAWASDMAIDASGRIVVAGTVDDVMTRDWFVARFTAEGALDPAFGSGGIAISDFGDAEVATGLAIDHLGRILVAGGNQVLLSGARLDFLIARYRADGSLDPTFDGDGFVRTDFNRVGEIATAIRVDAAGRIIVSGETSDGVSQNFALARYKSDGSLDSSFIGGGRLIVDLGAGANDVASALALDASGRMLVAGTTGDGISGDFALIRLDAAPPPPPADLTVIVGTDKPNTVNVGDLVTYTVTVANPGSNAADNVLVTNTLAGDATIVSASASNGALAVPPAGQAGVVSWNVGTLAPGSSAQMQLTVIISARGKSSVINEATVAADAPDPNPSNNIASIVTKVGAGSRSR